MDLLHFRTFNHPQISQAKKTRVGEDAIRIACYLFSATHQLLFLGLSSGQIFYWKRHHNDHKGKDPDLVLIESKHAHHGQVNCLLYETIGDIPLLISGSADRTIKLWEPKHAKQQNPCVQTIIGHGGTIICMRFIRKVQLLVTGSTDKTLRIWRVDKGRELLLYPWFVPLQIIKDFSIAIDSHVWICSLDIKEGENLAIFAGDSEGNLLTFRAPQDWRNSVIFEPSKRNVNIHRIGIMQVLLVVQENFVFTISYDQHLKGFDATNGSEEFFSQKNPNRALYTSIFWDLKHQELYVSDETGFVGVMNVYVDKPLLWKKVANERILRVEIIENVEKSENLLVCTDISIRFYLVRRGLKTHDMSGHNGPILSLITLEPQKMAAFKTQDEPKIISASLDNSIRFWDAAEMKTLSMVEAPEKSQISSITFLERCCLVATGHEDGLIRLWNLEINSSIELRSSIDKSTIHKNTVAAIASILWKNSQFLVAGGREYQIIGYDGIVSIWQISEKKSSKENGGNTTIHPQLRHIIKNVIGHQSAWGEEILAIKFDAKNETIVVGGNNQNIHIWEIESGKFLHALKGHTDSITCFEIEQNYLFSGSDDKTIRVWELVNRYCLYSLTGHQTSIQHLLMIKETGLLVSCAYDNKIKVWQYQRQRVLTEFERSQEFRCLAYISSKKMLLAGTNDKNIMTFPIQELLDPGKVKYLSAQKDMTSEVVEDQFDDFDLENAEQYEKILEVLSVNQRFQNCSPIKQMNIVQRVCRAGVDARDVDVEKLMEDEGDEEETKEEEEFQTFGGGVESFQQTDQHISHLEDDTTFLNEQEERDDELIKKLL